MLRCQGLQPMVAPRLGIPAQRNHCKTVRRNEDCGGGIAIRPYICLPWEAFERGIEMRFAPPPSVLRFQTLLPF